MPSNRAVVFRQETRIMLANIDGTEILPLIQGKEVERLVGIFPDPETDSDNLIFAAKNAQMNALDLWLAKIQGTELIALEALPYDECWLWLASVKLHEGRMLYEQSDYIEGKSVWNIYLSASAAAEGRKISSDEYHDYAPAWSPDGTKIVYVSKSK